MALRNLSGVTSTLRTLLQEYIQRLEDISVNVTPQPPDRVGDGQLNTISFYLYHICEEAYYTNIPGRGNDIPNVAKNPLALCLYYILTAHHDSQNEDDALTQQRLMGLAIKTLHDFPVITDNTAIDGTSILDPALQGDDNNLQIIMRPITPEDAVSFWSAEDQQTTRLSAYFEVRVVLLEPELPTIQPGLVLSLGTFLVDLGTPHLERSHSTMRFTIPQRNGGTEQAIDATPARVSLDNGGPPGSPNNRLVLRGTNLTSGRSRSLFLRNTLWTEQGFDRVEVDLGLNPTWNLEFRSDRVVVDIQSRLSVADPDGGPSVLLTVLPGAYTAFLRVVQDEKVISGELKVITAASNETGFFVTPRIVGPVPAVPAGNTIDIDVDAQFDIINPDLPADAIELTIDGFTYEQDRGDGFDVGEFTLASIPGISNTITINPRFDLTVTESQALACRLLFNGAESPPFWIELEP